MVHPPAHPRPDVCSTEKRNPQARKAYFYTAVCLLFVPYYSKLSFAGCLFLVPFLSVCLSVLCACLSVIAFLISYYRCLFACLVCLLFLYCCLSSLAWIAFLLSGLMENFFEKRYIFLLKKFAGSIFFITFAIEKQTKVQTLIFTVMKHVNKFEKLEAVCDFAPMIIFAIFLFAGLVF